MEHIRFGNFEVYEDSINWYPPGKREDYYGKKDEDLNYLLSESYVQKHIDEKIGKGWRLPYFSEIKYIYSFRQNLKIVNSSKFYFSTGYNYVIQETLKDNDQRRTFFQPIDGIENSQPWIPGFIITNTGLRNFRILPVRDV
jgi:hypothetical protein